MSSKRRLRRKSCDGKVRHADSTAALAHIRGLIRNGGIGQFDAYRCKFCKGYHVGHRKNMTKLRHTS